MFLTKAFQANFHLVHILSPLKKEYEDVSALAFGGGYYPEAFDEVLRERWQTLEEEGSELLRTKAKQAMAEGIISSPFNYLDKNLWLKLILFRHAFCLLPPASCLIITKV